MANMIPYTRCLKLLEDGFSLLTVGENKIPNFPWKKYQTEQPTEEDFYKYYHYQGGIIKANGQELTPTHNVGIITGYNDLECLDVDLKVLPTAKERATWWVEFLSFLNDNILDFSEKFAITKTMNDGYHILYKTKKLIGNKKIAALKGHTEAILETRSTGGYVFVYSNFLAGKNYNDIDYISDEDRDILFSVAATYNYIKPKEEVKHVVKDLTPKEGEITCWDDFNAKNSIWDIVKDDFSIVRNLDDKYIIKRDGGTSPHSGYIYKSENRMYLFSTGTIYDAEKQYTPFSAYVRKHFQDDFSAAAKHIYQEGYGSRIVSEKKIDIEPEEIDFKEINFPIHVFPKQIQDFIITARESLNNSIDYMGCSLLWVLSVSIGNSMKIEVRPGWHEGSTIWMVLVGNTGIGKTPSIKRITAPLEKKSTREARRYYKELEKFEHYNGLTKAEKQEHPEVMKPKKSHFLATDITLEALVDLHQESDNSVSVFKDELAGWFKDMNKYREGSDLEFWLSCWSGSPIVLSRITRKGAYIEQPCIPVLGGIQPEVLNDHNTRENKQNGFTDRMLLCYPDLISEKLPEKTIEYEYIEWFNDVIVSFFDTIRGKLVKRNIEGDIESHIAKMSKEAYALYYNQHSIITDMENSDETSYYLKSILPKQKAYIARFALLINTFNDFFVDNGNALLISEDSMKKAIDLSNYFIENAKKVKSESVRSAEIKGVINQNKTKSNFEKFEAIYRSNPDVDKKQAAAQLEVSVQMIYKYIKKLEK